MALVATVGNKELYLVTYNELLSLMDDEEGSLVDFYNLISKYCCLEIVSDNSIAHRAYVFREALWPYTVMACIVLDQFKHHIDIEKDKCFIYQQYLSRDSNLLTDAIEINKALSKCLFSLKAQYRKEFLFSFSQ